LRVVNTEDAEIVIDGDGTRRIWLDLGGSARRYNQSCENEGHGTELHEDLSECENEGTNKTASLAQQKAGILARGSA
jgi:hypothetical protein